MVGGGSGSRVALSLPESGWGLLPPLWGRLPSFHNFLWKKGARRRDQRSRSVPQGDGGLPEVVVSGEAAADRALHPLGHAVGQGAVAHHLEEQPGGVAEVEEVALPRPLEP